MTQIAIGPHATDSCLPELLRACRKAADELGCILTTHFAQTPEELALLRRRYGRAPPSTRAAPAFSVATSSSPTPAVRPTMS